MPPLHLRLDLIHDLLASGHIVARHDVLNIRRRSESGNSMNAGLRIAAFQCIHAKVFTNPSPIGAGFVRVSYIILQAIPKHTRNKEADCFQLRKAEQGDKFPVVRLALRAGRSLDLRPHQRVNGAAGN